jgi:hypothetical protein
MNSRAILIILILFILGVLSFFLWPKAPAKYLTNTTELYSLFTTYMQEHVNQSLKAVNCKPSKYYYNDSVVCFYCGSFDACFRYGMIARGTTRMMNPYGETFLKGSYDTTTLISFYSYGLTKALNCNCNGQCSCDNAIVAKLENNRIIITFPENINIRQKIREASEKAGLGDCEFKDSIFTCGILGGHFKSANEVEL